jgi:CBS domain containing-hemolysin-like protein
MDAFSLAAIILLVLCLCLVVFVAAAEAGLITVSRARIRLMAGRGIPRAEILQTYITERSTMLSALAIARNLAIVAGAALAVSIFAQEDGHRWEIIAGIVIGGLALSALLEAIPRALVARNPEWWGLRLAPLMGAFKVVFGGVGRLVLLPTRVVSRPSTDEEEEMLRFLEIEDAEGEIEDEERKMIRAVFDLEETAVREIMTPRTDFVAAEADANVDDVVRLIISRGFSRIPLYEDNLDNIVGIVYAKDLFRYLAEGRMPKQLRDIARPAFFVPESKRLDDLLTDMRKQRVHMAIVVDEYGGTAGLVTIEDLVEEIVGEIEDEYDRIEHPIVRISDDEALLDGRVSVYDLNELFNAEIEAEDFDTVGGCVFHMLGRVPTVGDVVHADGLTLTVLSVDGHRVRRVRAVRLRPPSEDTEAGNGNGKRSGKPENGSA